MEQLITFIRKIGKDTTAVITPETLLFKGKILDSMNILDLIGYVEKHIGRRLKDAEITMKHFGSPRIIVETFFTKS